MGRNGDALRNQGPLSCLRALNPRKFKGYSSIMSKGSFAHFAAQAYAATGARPSQTASLGFAIHSRPLSMPCQ